MDPCYSWTFVEAFWWGLMTITTVGYDLSPRTFLGKFIGGLCALSGIFILTLPIPIVVNSFGNFYKNRLWRNEVEVKKKERMRMRSLKNIQNEKQEFIKEITRYQFLNYLNYLNQLIERYRLWQKLLAWLE